MVHEEVTMPRSGTRIEVRWGGVWHPATVAHPSALEEGEAAPGVLAAVIGLLPKASPSAWFT